MSTKILVQSENRRGSKVRMSTLNNEMKQDVYYKSDNGEILKFQLTFSIQAGNKLVIFPNDVENATFGNPLAGELFIIGKPGEKLSCKA